jgi:DNA-binding MarR family transcriptional regulator
VHKNRRLWVADARTDSIRKTLEDLVVVRVARLADVVARLAGQFVTARLGVPYTDLRLLSLLDGKAGITVNEIARRAHIDRAWVSRCLRRLEEAGLVSRRGNPSDARVCVVTLSAKGRAALDEIRPLTAAREKRLLEGIDEACFKADLDRLTANAEALLASGTRSDKSREPRA